MSTEARQRPMLIVDEAHHLRNDVLEDLRLLTNYAMDAERRLCLLFVGLTREELPAYLTHRLQLAGTTLPLFESAAVEALFQATQGLPCKVNRTAHYALSAAVLAKTKLVSAEHLHAALEELKP